MNDLQHIPATNNVIKPPLGLMPKSIYTGPKNITRFNAVCGAISRYYKAGLKIDIDWINEYNELVESFGPSPVKYK